MTWGGVSTGEEDHDGLLPAPHALARRPGDHREHPEGDEHAGQPDGHGRPEELEHRHRLGGDERTNEGFEDATAVRAAQLGLRGPLGMRHEAHHVAVLVRLLRGLFARLGG